MVIKVFFFVAIFMCLIALVFSITQKNKNFGYILTTGLLLVMDVVCIMLLDAPKLRYARTLLMVYYILFACMFFSTLLVIVKMYYGKWFHWIMFIMLGLSLLETGLITYCFAAPQVVSVSKQVHFGKMWWILGSASGHKGLLGLQMYSALSLLSALFIIAFLIHCVRDTYYVFKGKYVILVVMQVILIAIAFAAHFQKWPVWIETIIMNPICYFTYYYVFVFSNLKLRDSVITAFANEMSDGLLLYNNLNELIHANDLIKNTFSSESVEKMKDIKKVEEWANNVQSIESIDVVKYKFSNQERFFIVKKEVLGTEKNYVGTAFVLHDTTNSINRIRMMEQVNRELERTAQMKSDFLANMSHELRTPMNAVIGMAEIALREENSPRVKDCLNQITNSGRNLLNIINDILDYSKIESGKMEIFPERYMPVSEINDIANILQTRIGDKDINFQFLAEPTVPHELIGDSMRIRQVIINIANNAIKFTEKGYVRIILSCERISEDEVMLHYKVKDSGRGIKPEDLDKLFVSFQQVDSKRNRNVEGTGLGLAISKRLVEAMGGEIGVTSEYGKGSVFWFNIPQKIADPSRDLVVENASDVFAFGVNENDDMVFVFSKEMDFLGVDYTILRDISEYKPTDRSREFLFIMDSVYGSVIEDFLDKNPKVTAVVLTDQSSGFKPTRKNVVPMVRPTTTLGMVLTLNGKKITDITLGEHDMKEARYTAPEAKVLIVDDAAINLSIATGLIEPLKIKCDTALSGNEAINKLRIDHYDLVLMDHMMPGMDGIETTQIIRKMVPQADDTPIIALTANVMEGSKEMFFKAGMVDLIAKPIDVRQLNAKLKEWLPKDKIIEKEGPEEESVNALTEDIPYAFLDYKTAIERIGTADLYKKIVEDYYRKGNGTLNAIEESHEKKDWADYSIRTHTLKSTSRQIGATELGDLAEKLEHAGKAEDTATIEKYHSETMEMFKKTLSDLEPFFESGGNGTAEHPPVNDEELRATFEKLSAACDELDMDIMEECGEWLKKYSYPEDKREIIEELCSAIEQIDAGKCVELMGRYSE